MAIYLPEMIDKIVTTLAGLKANWQDYVAHVADDETAHGIDAIIGQVSWFATSSAPSGWLKCDGAAVSRTTYSVLFTKIGTAFGAGDGSTTFNLPDLRGEFIRGYDDGRGIDSGRTFGSSQSDVIKDHHHYVPVLPRGGTYENTGYKPDYHTLIGGGAKQYSPTSTEGFISGTSGDETRPRNIALLACIKY